MQPGLEHMVHCQKRRMEIMACQPQATASYKMLNPTPTPPRNTPNPQKLNIR